MTVINIFKNDPTYLELQSLHIRCCVIDLVDLFTVVATDTYNGTSHHAEFAKHMMDVRAAQRNYMPSEPVDMKDLMIFASVGMFSLIRKNIEKSLNSAPIDGENPSLDRIHAKNFVLQDTSAAIALALDHVLSDPKNLPVIERVSAYSEQKLAESIQAFLEQKYQAPSNEELNHAITQRWLALGIDPTQRNSEQPYFVQPRFG
jgi:hypothetical protein